MGVAHELPCCPALGETAIPPFGLPKMCQEMMSLATEGVTSVHDSKYNGGAFRGHD